MIWRTFRFTWLLRVLPDLAVGIGIWRRRCLCVTRLEGYRHVQLGRLVIGGGRMSSRYIYPHQGREGSVREA